MVDLLMVMLAVRVAEREFSALCFLRGCYLFRGMLCGIGLLSSSSDPTFTIDTASAGSNTGLSMLVWIISCIVVAVRDARDSEQVCMLCVSEVIIQGEIV